MGKELTCKGCRFWKFLDGGYGFCRRYPPNIVEEHPFPKVYPSEWCGEFQSDRVVVKELPGAIELVDDIDEAMRKELEGRTDDF